MKHTPVILLLLVGVVMAGCQPAAGAAWRGIMKVGLGAPFSGYDAETAPAVHGAVQRAIRERNARGGIHGYRLELVAHDDEMQAAVAARRARELVADPDVVVALGHFSGDLAQVAGEVYAAGSLPYVSLAPGELPASGVVARTLPSDDEIAEVVGRQLSDRIVGRRAAIVTVATPGFRRQGAALARSLDRRGWTLVFQGDVLDRTLRFEAEMEALRRTQAEVVIFVGLPDQGRTFFDRIAEVRSDAWLFGAGTVDGADWRLVGRPERVLWLGLGPPLPVGPAQERRSGHEGSRGAATGGRPYGRGTPLWVPRPPVTARLWDVGPGSGTTSGVRAPTDYAALAYAVVVRLLDVLVEESRGSAPSRAAMAVALRSTVDAEGHLTLAPRSASLGQVEVRVMTNE